MKTLLYLLTSGTIIMSLKELGNFKGKKAGRSCPPVLVLKKDRILLTVLRERVQVHLPGGSCGVKAAIVNVPPVSEMTLKHTVARNLK